MSIKRINVTPGGGVSSSPAGNQTIEFLAGVPRYLPISADGRFVLFQSPAGDLLAGDDPEHPRNDVFLYDQQTGALERIGRDVTGGADIESAAVGVSTDGRYVTFRSYDQITPESGPSGSYLYVYDRTLQTTEMVDIGPMTSEGQPDLQQHLTSYRTVSGDARFVYFSSSRSDVMPGDANGKLDAFLVDRATGVTTRISLQSDGSEFTGDSRAVDMSADGSYLILRTDTPDGREGSFWFKDMTTGALTQLPALGEHWRIAGDGRTLIAFGAGKISVIDLETGETGQLFSGLGTLLAADVAVSGDGRFVTFRSTAANIVSGDTNGVDDVFVHDRATGETVRVNVTPDGAQSDGWLSNLEGVAISDDGKWITFVSDANNLAGGKSGVDKAFVASNPFLDVPDPLHPNYVIGGEGDNTLAGTGHSDMIEALAGSDTVASGAGDDVIFGRQGDDSLHGEAGRDSIFGHEGDDTLSGGLDADVLVGGEGDDAAHGGEGGDVLLGDAEAADALNGADSLYGEAGDDSLYGGGGDDLLVGGDHNDYLVGGEGDDRLEGGAGDDRFVLGRGDDRIFGGEGQDVLHLTGSASDYVIDDRLPVSGDGGYTSVVSAATGIDHISGVERAEFTTLRTNVAVVENKFLTLARAADNAYKDVPTPVQGWQNLSALELGIDIAGTGTTASGVAYDFTFANGVYSAVSTLPGGIQIEAAATVQFAIVDGQATLMISFRGTDQLTDVLDYFPFGMHYDKYEPFLAAIDQYIQNNGYAAQDAIDQVWVSGHSLGGAMAQHFMQDARFSDALFSGATFGSPGAELSVADSRLLHFEHTGDGVPYAGDIVRAETGILSKILSFGLSDQFLQFALEWVSGDPTDFRTSGGVIRTVTDTGLDLLDQHSMTTYLPTLERFAAQQNLLPFMRGVGVSPGTHLDINVGGAGADILEGAAVGPVALLRGDDYFGGDELFVGGGGADVLSGGIGSDHFLGTLQDLHMDRIVDLSGGESIRVAGVKLTANDISYSPGQSEGVLRIGTTEIRLAGHHPGTFTVEAGAEYTEIRYTGDVGLTGDGDDDVLAGGEGDDVLVGGGGDDRVSGGGGDDQLYGDGGPDEAAARPLSSARSAVSGDDFLEGGGGDDIIDGGLGQDVVHLSGGREDYMVVLRKDDPDQIQLIDLREGAPDGHDQVVGVELFDFGGVLLTLAELAQSGPVDYAPELLGETVSIAASAGPRSIDVLSNDYDPDEGDSLQIVGRYVVQDDHGAVSTAAVTVIVYGPRTGPVAVDDTVNLREGETADLALVLLANDWQSEGQDLEERKIVAISRDGTKGELAFDPKSGQLTYTAGEAFTDLKPGQFGEDSFTYTLENADGVRTVATARIRVEGTLSDSEWVHGTEGADLLQGDGAPDALRGLGGNDTLNGAGGADWLDGGDDHDQISGGAGNDSVWGRAGDDTLDGGAGGDLLRGGEGDDVLISGEGVESGPIRDVLDGGAGFDTAVIDHSELQLSPRYRFHGIDFELSETGAETEERSSSETYGWQVIVRNVEHLRWTGGDWHDEVTGGRYGDTISGGAGDDELRGRAGDDRLEGGEGHDELIGGSGNDSLSGGAGGDVLSGDKAAPSLGTQIAESVSSDTFDDYLDGGAGSDGLFGGRGDDTLVGGSGIDYLEGGAGDDIAVLDGARSNYSLVSIGGYGGKYALIDLRAGPLGINFETGEWPEDLTDGFDIVGDDVEVFSFAGELVAFDSMFSWIEGTQDDDDIAGTAGGDQIRVFAGDDTVNGGGGIDLIRGGLGDDLLNGESGQDRLYGEDGHDTLDGGAGQDVLKGGAGDDLLIGEDQDTLIDGGSGHDLAHLDFSAAEFDLEFSVADSQEDALLGAARIVSIEQVELLGGLGADRFIGGAFNDTLGGGVGDDTLSGGNGDDMLAAGPGSDIIDGGGGRDVVVFAGRRADYGVEKQEDGSYVITDLRADAPDGTTTTTRVEAARFSDGVIKLDGDIVPNRPPAALDDDVTVDEDGVVRIEVRENDSDPDGDVLSKPQFGLSDLRGEIEVREDGSLIYRPGEAFQYLREGQTAQEQITYTVEDGAGGIATAELRVTVTGVNDRPTANADQALVNKGGVTANLWQTLLGNDVDPDDGDKLTIVAVDVTGAHGTVAFDTDAQTLIYSAGDQVAGATDTFTYTVRDASGAESTGSVTITIGGPPDDGVIRGGEGDDTLVGTERADRIEGRGGDDLLVGGEGADTLLGGAGDDTLQLSLGDVASGETGSDVFAFGPEAAGVVITDFAAGAGGDVLDVSAFVAGDIDPFGLGLLRFEAHQSGSVLVFDADGPSGPGGGVAVAILEGVLPGALGPANISASGAGGAPVVVDPSPINVQVGGAKSENLIGGAGRDLLAGMDGTDMLRGGGGNDVIDGGDGWDALFGDAGDDVLFGGLGADALNGGVGKDTLDGGAGADVLTGGAGTDRFVFGLSSGIDAIADFQAGRGAGDVIDFTALRHITSFADVQARLSSDSSGAAVIDLGEGAQLTLRGVKGSALDADDFVFASASRLMGQSSSAAQPDPWMVA